MPNGPVFECHLNTGQPDHLNAEQMDAILFSYELVQYSNGRLTIQIPNHFKSKLKKVWYSNVSGIQVVGIQIPTVVKVKQYFCLMLIGIQVPVDEQESAVADCDFVAS